VTIGELPPGPTNTIVDVDGVHVGHVTCWEDDDGAARTGVTAVIPTSLEELFRAPMAAGTAVLNGAGELTGSIQIDEWGLLETPVLLTGTTAVGRAYDAVTDAMLAAVPTIGVYDVVIPVVGECNDSWLDNARRRTVTVEHAREAIDTASAAPPALGTVGAGTGMTAFGCKGGIGSASRRVADLDATVGVLALTNFGDLERLSVAGAPYGKRLMEEGFTEAHGEPTGSCIVLVATDAPLDPQQCRRLAVRAGLGLARAGSTAHHGSGEIFLAWSTTARSSGRSGVISCLRPPVAARALDPLFGAVVEATEEAVIDALFVSDTVVGRDGHRSPALPTDRLG
jgi:D-aminopeptidase